ncbi:prolyl oligopeptidase family serine peptidase [Alteromonas sp. a30]|uniref:prolyl oligopeptidase family serine peptidase n=1 Tax=Alteromonas sp. a30 TaxID=2730917 RepID=UPI0022830A0F|nr:prolyl oligopeptidase family serine peptidase [Alteromonas sp. a30]MCY7296502.1 prolyl oligopeptidase family serine peptidase [Alteromonas sp. a30]
MRIANVIRYLVSNLASFRIASVLLACFISFFSVAGKIPVRDLFAPAQISHIEMSPDGKLIAAQTRDDDKRYITIFDTATLQSYKKLRLYEKESLRELEWVDNNTIYIGLMRGKAEYVTGYIDLDLAQLGELVEFTYLRSVGDIIDFLPNEEDTVLFSKNTGKYVIDLKIYKAKLSQLTQPSGQNEAAKDFEEPIDYKSDAISYIKGADPQTLFAVTFDEAKKSSSLWYQLSRQGDWNHLYTWNNQDFYFHPISHISGDTFLVITNKDTDTKSAVRFNARTQKIEEVLYQHEKYDLTSATMNNNKTGLGSVSYFEYGNLRTEFLSDTVVALSSHIQSQLDGKKWYVVSNSLDNNTAVVLALGKQDSGAFYVLSSANAVEGASSEPELTIRLLATIMKNAQDYTFAATQTYSLATPDDDEIEVLLTEPVRNNNNVLLVMPHGGPIGVRDDAIFNNSVQFLADRGYTVLRVNFRGSSGFGKRFQKKGRAQFGKLIEQDIMLAVNDLLQKQSFEHLCSIGTSYGGYSALMLSIQNPDLFSCAVGGYGVYDLPLLFNASNRKMNQQYINAVTRVVGKNSEDLKRVSPVYLVDKVNVPVLLLAGTDDNIAVFEHSNRMKYMLEKFNKPVETVFYKGVGHGHHTWGGDWHESAIIDRFLRETLSLPALPDKEADLQEYVALADYFSGDTLVGDQEALALKYYRLAAELGHDRSMFNVGAYYHRGDQVEKDLNMARMWYEKSSEAGNSGASHRLGYLLMQGDYQSPPIESEKSDEETRPTYRHHKRMKQTNHVDQVNAVKAFQKAVEQGNDAESLVYLGFAYCMGLGVEKNVDKCIEYLSLEERGKDKEKDLANPVTTDSYSARRAVLATIMIEGKYTDEEYDKLNAMMQSVRAYQEIPFQLDDMDYGTFGPFHFRLSKSFRHYYSVTRIPLQFGEEEETRYGIKFEVEPQDSDYDSNVAVFIRWSRKLEDETDFVVEDEKLTIRNINYPFPVLRMVDENDKVNSQWRVEIFSTRGKKLHQQDFTIVEAE